MAKIVTDPNLENATGSELKKDESTGTVKFILGVYLLVESGISPPLTGSIVLLSINRSLSKHIRIKATKGGGWRDGGT